MAPALLWAALTALAGMCRGQGEQQPSWCFNNKYDQSCAARAGRYLPRDENVYNIKLVVKCEDLDTLAPTEILKYSPCHTDIFGSKESGFSGWKPSGIVRGLRYTDDLAKYQGSEWNSQTGQWPDKLVFAFGINSEPAKISDGCSVADGYCRKRRVCTVSGYKYGKVKIRDKFQGGTYDWKDSMEADHEWSDYRVFQWYNHFKTWRCLLCQVYPCDYSCPNGNVFGAPVPTVEGRVVTRLDCGKSCSPGTFLTCTSQLACSYMPLTDAQRAGGNTGLSEWSTRNYEAGKGAQLLNWGVASPPVEDCYPCRFAYNRLHYGQIANSDVGLYQKDFLQFRCPGGKEAPVPCGGMMVTKILPSNRTTDCGCMGGYYDSGGQCRRCEAGFYCAWEDSSPPVRRPCPDDTYSTGGAEACTPCSKSSSRCDKGYALTRCLRDAEGTGKNQVGDASCVRCHQCQQLGGEVPCYRVVPNLPGN